MFSRGKRIFFAAAVATALFNTACSSDNGSSTETPNQNTGNQPAATATPQPTAQPTPKPTVKPTPAPTPTPTPAPIGKPGEFVKQVTLTEAEAANNYGYGCLAAGQPESRKMIDIRQKVGDETREKVTMADDVTDYTFTMRSTLLSLTEFTSRSQSRILTSNISTIPPGTISHTNCEVKSDTVGECTGESSVQMSGIRFFIFVPLGQTATEYEKGWYILDDGKAVEAWRKTIFAQGQILDPMGFALVGAGMQVDTKIYAPGIPATGIEFCGGTEVFGETLVQTSAGIVLNRFGGQLLGVTLKPR